MMDLSFWTYLGITCSLFNALIDFDRENYSWSLFWVVWAILLGVNNLNG